MSKYKFRLSETNYIVFTEKELKEFQDVEYTNDKGIGKRISIKRDFDGCVYDIITPLELIEELKEDV